MYTRLNIKTKDLDKGLRHKEQEDKTYTSQRYQAFGQKTN